MNVDTGEVRLLESLTEGERASGVWQPVSGEFAELLEAERARLEVQQVRKFAELRDRVG